MPLRPDSFSIPSIGGGGVNAARLPGPTGLAATYDASEDTWSISFDPVPDAVSHEYRLNWGTWVSLGIATTADDLSGHTDGTNTVQVRGVDAADKAGRSTTVTFQVAPYFTFLTPTGGNIYQPDGASLFLQP